MQTSPQPGDPPPATSPPLPALPTLQERGAGTGAAPEPDSVLLAKSVPVACPSAEWHCAHAPPAGWVAPGLPGNKGLPQEHPFQLGFQPVQPQWPCPCCSLPRVQASSPPAPRGRREGQLRAERSLGVGPTEGTAGTRREQCLPLAQAQSPHGSLAGPGALGSRGRLLHGRQPGPQPGHRGARGKSHLSSGSGWNFRCRGSGSPGPSPESYRPGPCCSIGVGTASTAGPPDTSPGRGHSPRPVLRPPAGGQGA